MPRRSRQETDISFEGGPCKNAKVEKPRREPGLGCSPCRPRRERRGRHIRAEAPDLWWHDGNVIVVSRYLSFRVHASILQKDSSVFTQLLSNLQACEGLPEGFEGCRVLRVPDDGSHIAEVFRILYDGGRGGFFDWRKPVKFAQLRRITHIAAKYKIQLIIDEAVSRLSYVFPTSFEPDRLDFGYFVGTPAGCPVHFSSATDAIGAVVLARAIDPLSPPPFIAMALYHCMSLEPHSLLDPVEYGFGDVALLPHADFRVCLKAQACMAKACASVRSTVVCVLERPLCDRLACRLGVRSLVCGWLSPSESHVPPQPLQSSRGMMEIHAERHPGKLICHHCAGELVKGMEDTRKSVFKDLGKAFNIPTWPASQQQA